MFELIPQDDQRFVVIDQLVIDVREALLNGRCCGDLFTHLDKRASCPRSSQPPVYFKNIRRLKRAVLSERVG